MAKSSLVAELSALPLGSETIWTGEGGNQSFTSERSRFVMLSCAAGGEWRPISIDRKLVRHHGGVAVFGSQVVHQSLPTEECRFLFEQPDRGEPTVYLRGATGNQRHSGYLLFVKSVLCERKRETGKAGPWEQMEMRPTRFGDDRCFHLWSAAQLPGAAAKPVCFDDEGDGFVRRKLRLGEDPVVFSMEGFENVTSRLPRDGDVFHSILEHTSSIFTSAIKHGSESHSGSVGPAGELKPAFELLETIQHDLDTGELIKASSQVVRGSRRVQKVVFIANEDLNDLARVAKVRIGWITTSVSVPLGDFPKRAEPYEFQFPEESVPKRAPPLAFTVDIQYTASNIGEPLHKEHCSLKMV